MVCYVLGLNSASHSYGRSGVGKGFKNLLEPSHVRSLQAMDSLISSSERMPPGTFFESSSGGRAPRQQEIGIVLPR